MNHNNRDFFLIYLEKEKFEPFFGKLLSSGVTLEMLDPRELGPKWQAVTFLETSQQGKDSEQNNFKLSQIQRVIESYCPSFSFEEQRESGDINQILENWQEKNLFDAVQRLGSNSIIDRKFLQQKLILKKIKGKWQVTIIKDLKALYTRYEIVSKLPLIRKKLFQIEASTEVTFACFATLQTNKQAVIDTLTEHNIDYEITGWTHQIQIKNHRKPAGHSVFDDVQNRPLPKLPSFLYYFMCGLVIHDILAGLVITAVSLFAYRFNLKNKAFVAQLWTGLGAIILGIVSGSFGGNMLQVLSTSKYLVVKAGSNLLLDFVGLFQMVDWTNQNPNLLLNSSLKSQNISPLGFLVLSFALACVVVGICMQIYKIRIDYKSNLFKPVVVRCIFVLTIICFALYAINLIALWPCLALLFGLTLYQPDLQITTKLKMLVVGEFGLLGFIILASQFLWFAAAFGLLVGSSLVFNLINNATDNLFIMLFGNLVATIIMWQLTAFVVAKTLQANITDQHQTDPDDSSNRSINPVIEYKYWKL
jgi:hypothetical protein